MREPLLITAQVTWKRPLIDALRELVVHAFMVLTVIFVWGSDHLFEHILVRLGDASATGLLMRLHRWILMSVVTLLIIRIAIDLISSGYYRLIYFALKNYSSENIYVRKMILEIRTYLVAVAGFTVVFALISRAEAVRAEVPKFLVYTAAFVLSLEILAYWAVNVRANIPTLVLKQDHTL